MASGIDSDGDVVLDAIELGARPGRRARVVIVTLTDAQALALEGLTTAELALLEARIREDVTLSVGLARSRPAAA